MKRLILTILAIFYLGVSSGATVHFHYCMGQLIEWGLSDTNAGPCSNCGREESETKKCCNDQSRQFKVEKSQKASQNAYQFNLPEFDLFLASFNEPHHILASFIREEYFLSIEPQRTQNTPVFVLNCNFRI